MDLIMNTSNFQELSMNELEFIDGGAWSWKAFGQSTIAGAVGGGITGATGGSMVLPIVESVPGALGGGILGGIGGAAAYAVCGWW